MREDQDYEENRTLRVMTRLRIGNDGWRIGTARQNQNYMEEHDCERECEA